MGERVQAYWGRFENVSFVPPPCPDCKAKQAQIDRLRTALEGVRDWTDDDESDPGHLAIEALRETKP
jgi:hypothetical protein